MFKELVHVFGLCAVLAPVGAAQTYYSIDVTNDKLYTINPSTGAATLVGPLLADLDGVDLAWHQGALYAKSYGTVNGGRIYQIVTEGVFAGLALPGAPLNGGGYQGGEAGGLASNGVDLYLAYSDQPAPDYFSTQFSVVNPFTGTISAPTTIPTDADGMGFIGGQFWTVDVISVAGGVRIYRGNPAPNILVGVDTFDPSQATNPVDIEFFSQAEHVSVSGSGRNLIRIDRLTGMRVLPPTPITGIPSDAVMKGLARSRPCTKEFTSPL